MGSSIELDACVENTSLAKPAMGEPVVDGGGVGCIARAERRFSCFAEDVLLL